ncbi:MAG: hypothetical protein HUU50_20780 [Candidatus Brocadiae bacterium]|nr:hypothetical protein [Candidatus Brocadiia bacterium]
MNLSDAFTRRKEIQEEISLWTNRLEVSGCNRKVYLLDTEKKEVALKEANYREYTIEECLQSLHNLMQEDKNLAIRISKTNARVEVELEDFDGQIRKVSIAELLILKESIIPNMQKIVQCKPVADLGKEVKKMQGYIEYESIQPSVKQIEDVKEGVKITKQVIEGYTKVVVEDFGISQRQKYDEQDKINHFARRVKKALNEANKAELVA